MKWWVWMASGILYYLFATGFETPGRTHSFINHPAAEEVDTEKTFIALLR